MTRSAQFARPFAAMAGRITFLMLSVFAALLVATGTAGAATNVGAYTLYTTADLCKLTVSPKAASAAVGASQSFSATITAIGPDLIGPSAVDASYSDTYDACAFKDISALEGVTVAFKIVSGPNAGQAADVALDANGVATYTFSSAAAGVDVVEASLTLPDICIGQPNGQAIDDVAVEEIPVACEDWFGPQVDAVECGDNQLKAVPEGCPDVTLTDSGQVTWSAPAVVTQSADPTLTIASRKRCVTRQFTIAPVYSGGTIVSSTLFVDGKKKQTKNGSAPFKLSARSYKAGKHNFEVVTVFSSGKAASKFGSFTRCAARVSVKRVSPKFTG